MYFYFRNRLMQILSKGSLFLLIVAFTAILFGTLQTNTYAYSIEPSTVEYDLKKGENKFANINFTNTDDYPHEFTVKILNSNNEIISGDNTEYLTNSNRADQTIFIKTEKSQFTLNPKESISIPYAVLTDESMQIGTYYNVIAIINKDFTNNELINVEGGIGSVIKLNLLDESSAVLGTSDFYESTKLDIKVLDYGWINKPMKIQIDFTNNTPYELTPLGSVDIYSLKRLGIVDDQESGPFTFLINENNSTVASKDTISWEFESNVWNFKSLFSPVKILAEVVNEGDTYFIEKEISINHPLKLTLIVLTALVSFITLISLVNIFTRKKNRSKRVD